MQPNNQNIPRNTFRNRPRQTVDNRPADGSGPKPAGNYTRPEPPANEPPDLLRQIRTAIRRYPLLNTIYLYSIRVFIWLFLGSIGWVIILKYIPVWVTPLVVSRKLDAMGDDKSAKVYKKWRSLDEISKEAALAVVASEDQQFPVHWGFDFDEIQDAIKENKTRKRPRGASTISQQVAKNVFLWNGRSYIRKGLEVYFTVLIELIWGKKRILEVYLNVAETGPLTFGVEAASQRYYGHTAKLLSRDEAARIAAVLPNPIKFSIEHPSSYILRRDPADFAADAGAGRAEIPQKSLECQFGCRVPEQRVEVDYLIIVNADAFGFEAFLHGSRGAKKVFSGKDAQSVHHAVGRNTRLCMGAVHGPTNHAGTRPQAQVPGNGSVGRYPTFRNLPDNVIDILKIIAHDLNGQKPLAELLRGLHLFFCLDGGDQFVVPFLAVGTDECLADKLVDRYLQLFAETTGRAANRPAVVIQGMIGFVFGHADRIEVAGNRFLPVNHAIVVGFFDAAFQDAFVVVNGINAFTPANRRGHIIAVDILLIQPLLFNGFDAGRRKVRFDFRVNLFEHFGLTGLQRSAHIAFYTAGTFAFVQVADKKLVSNVITDAGVID